MHKTKPGVQFVALLLLTACNVTQISGPWHVYLSHSAGVAVEITSARHLDTDALAVMELGIERGYERWTRCKGVLPERSETLTIHVVARLQYGYAGLYDPTEDAVYLVDTDDHETLEHELADHRLPILARDPNWQHYGHSLPSVCADGT